MMSDFKTILKDTKKLLEDEGYAVSSSLNNKQQNWEHHIKVGDKKKTPFIGKDKKAHYEIILTDNRLSVEFHYERGSLKKDFRYNTKINSFIDNNIDLRWHEDNQKVRIQFGKKYSLQNSIPEDLKNKIIEFENLIGDIIIEVLSEIEKKKIEPKHTQFSKKNSTGCLPLLGLLLLIFIKIYT
jgi:hypothetical protein